MTESMLAHSRLVVEQFCALCDKAHEYWLNHLELFDNNPRKNELINSVARSEWVRLSVISQEYSLLQIRKLHDPAVTSGKITLGIDYMLTYGGWSDSVRSRLEELARELNGLADKLKGVRNKILSHNDLATIVAGATLGELDKGTDEKYFRDLQEFVNIVHFQVAGSRYTFEKSARDDAAIFLRTIKPSP